MEDKSNGVVKVKMTLAEEVKSEVEILGLDVSGHLLSFYAKLLNQLGAVRVKDFLNFRSNTGIFLAGVKVAVQSPPVRSGKRTIFLSLDDGSGCSDSTFFESTQIHSARTIYNSNFSCSSTRWHLYCNRSARP